jgi:hypothetical protein
MVGETLGAMKIVQAFGQEPGRASASPTPPKTPSPPRASALPCAR